MTDALIAALAFSATLAVWAAVAWLRKRRTLAAIVAEHSRRLAALEAGVAKLWAANTAHVRALQAMGSDPDDQDGKDIAEVVGMHVIAIDGLCRLDRAKGKDIHRLRKDVDRALAALGLDQHAPLDTIEGPIDFAAASCRGRDM